MFSFSLIRLSMFEIYLPNAVCTYLYTFFEKLIKENSFACFFYVRILPSDLN